MTGQGSGPRPLPVPPPVVALAAALAQRRLTPDAEPPGPARRALAGALAVGSLATAVSANVVFHRSDTTENPFRPDQASALVQSGPFRVTRNPMYLGLTGVLLAHAVRRGSPLAVLPVAGFVALVDRVQIRAEEAALRRKFGAEYDVFTERVPRWVGMPAGS